MYFFKLNYYVLCHWEYLIPFSLEMKSILFLIRMQIILFCMEMELMKIIRWILILLVFRIKYSIRISIRLSTGLRQEDVPLCLWAGDLHPAASPYVRVPVQHDHAIP